MSGMKVSHHKVGGALSRSIARGFGLRHDQNVYHSDIFKSTRSRSSSYAKSHARSTLFGHEDVTGGRDLEYNDKLYWLIGKDTDVTVPNQSGAALEAMRAEVRKKGGSNFARQIVLLDFTGDEKRGAPIMRDLLGMGEYVRLIRAGIDYTPNHQGTPIAGTITHGSEQYTPEQFGDIVGTTNRLDERIPSNPGQSLERDGMPATKKSKTSEPIDMSGFRELSTENEWWSIQYPMIREHRENMSVLDEVPAHVWPE